MTDVTVTQAGSVRGVVRGGAVAFEGIPYGDDTAGDGRFRGARPARGWTGVRECLTYGPSCPQVPVGVMMGRELPADAERSRGVWHHERVMSEDCLVLNVWTPPWAMAIDPSSSGSTAEV